jgi:hypothetical protein
MNKSLPYKSKVIGTKLVESPKTFSFKVYFVDLLGREPRNKYEWEHSGLNQGKFLEKLETILPEGVGFVTAFPHITKAFQFGPEPETNLYAQAYHTQSLERISLKHGKSTEIACAAEMEIAADEFAFWAQATDVDSYLKQFSGKGTTEIKDHTKLYRHLVAGH